MEDVEKILEEGKKYFPKLKLIDTRFYLNYPQNKGSFSIGGFKTCLVLYKIQQILKWLEKKTKIQNLYFSKATISAYFETNNKQVRISDHKKSSFEGLDILITWDTSSKDIVKILEDSILMESENKLRKSIGLYLTESLTDEKFLNKLSNDILKHIAEVFLKKEKHLIWKRTEEDGSNSYNIYAPDFDIYKYTLDLGSYPENIKDWIENNGLRIIFTTYDKQTNFLGSYKSPKTIYLSYESNSSVLEDLWLMIQGKYISFGDQILNTKATDIYIKLFYKYHSTLLHELRHAFDDYRSKRKYLNTKRWFNHLEKHSDALENLNNSNIDPDKLFKLKSNNYKSYLKLAHEINARFSQALSKIHFDKFIDDSWEIKEKKLFEEVLKDFKYQFENWRLLTPKMQQWITKRLYKYWDEHTITT